MISKFLVGRKKSEVVENADESGFGEGQVGGEVRGYVARALVNLQDRESLPDLRALLRDKGVNFSVREYIRDALWKMARVDKIPIRFE